MKNNIKKKLTIYTSEFLTIPRKTFLITELTFVFINTIFKIRHDLKIILN